MPENSKNPTPPPTPLTITCHKGGKAGRGDRFEPKIISVTPNQEVQFVCAPDSKGKVAKIYFISNRSLDVSLFGVDHFLLTKGSPQTLTVRKDPSVGSNPYTLSFKKPTLRDTGGTASVKVSSN